MIIGLKLRLFIYPLNVGKLSLLVVFTMIIFTINVQKMAKDLSFTWSWSQFTLLREINAIFKNSRLIKRLFARRYLSGALNSATLISRVEIRQQGWNYKEPLDFFAWPPSYIHVRKKPRKKFDFRKRLTNWFCWLNKFCFFVSVVMISFIFNCYPLFRVLK